MPNPHFPIRRSTPDAPREILPGAPPEAVFAVSDLTELLRALVEDSLPSLWVTGEISNFSKPSSGHWYFTLKDARAQIRCAMFKPQNFYVRPQPRDGDAVLVRARAGIYAARGELQLIVEHLEAAGTGALLRAFEALEQRLHAEGLFDPAAKRPIPPVPRAIGLITSGSGAALQDICAALARRWPLAPVYLLPVPVQGAEAAPAIVRALDLLPRRAAVDVILLARGGGSLEDLWTFNEEAIARAIRGCAVPVVTGIGHEIDLTIADLAADLRAPTPTAAAELATPDQQQRRARLAELEDGLARVPLQRLRETQRQLAHVAARLHSQHPGRRLQLRAQQLDELAERLRHAQTRRLQQLESRLLLLASGLLRQTPRHAIEATQSRGRALSARLQAHAITQLAHYRTRLDRSAALLASLDPSAVVQRGYAIVRGSNGRILRDASAVAPGDPLQVELAQGEVRAVVTSTRQLQEHPAALE